MPARIYPGVQVDPNSDMTGYTLISILFNQELGWQFEATNPDSSNQIFAYFPSVIANALGIDREFFCRFMITHHTNKFFATTESNVKTLYLQVYVPATYQSAADVTELGTMYLAYIPSDDVSTLAAQIKVKSSQFYTGTSGIAQQLAARVDSGFALNSVADPNAGTDGGSSSSGGGSSSSASSKTRQDAIIGVVSALGAIALIILGVLVWRSYQRRKELGHRRLSDPDQYAGARPDGQEFDRDSIGAPRRRSFYYAADAAAHSNPDDDHYDYRSSPENGMRERRPVVPGTISTPYLQQSSMNW